MKVPQIKTDVATPNFSNFFSAIDKAEKQATIKIKPEIDKSFGGGLSSFLNSEKGKFNNVGKELGQNLTMGMQQQFGMAGGMASSLAQALGPVGIAATVAGAGVLALGAASVNAARGWETLMAGVSKTTGAEGAALTQLSNTLLNLSKEMPIAQAEIAKIATVGGTLGVKQSDLPKFVKDTAMASAGWGMSGEEAANSIAGISNAFKVPIADAQKFGSVINTMADNVGGSEKELADFLVRASGIATTFDEGIASTTAFGAVLASINMPMEVAATGLQSMMSYAMAPSSPERLEQWAGMMNVTVDQLKAKLEQDLYGTLIESSNAIASVGTETEQQQARIAIWGEGGARVSSGLVGMQDKYNEALKMGNEQLATGSSLAQAFGAQGATVDAKWQKFTNTMSTALIHIGTAALPVLGQVLDTMSGLISKADEFAATTLPAWAQSTTDWVNKTLGMEEDTDEEIAARKAKIARTAEKTVTKVADTTGYQSYAEAQASAANFGQGTGNSYVDGLNSALDTGLPKALTDAYLGDALKVSTEAAKVAGGLTGEEWVKAYGSAASAGMTQVNGKWVSNQERESFYKDKSLKSGEYSTFANGEVAWNLLKESASGKSGTLKAVISVDGTEYTREFSTLEDTAESATKKIKAEFRDVAIDIPKYIKQYGGDVSDALSNALSDGVISFTEKNELLDYIKSLEQMRVEFPVEFDTYGLDKTLEDYKNTYLGIKLKLQIDTGEIETNLDLWLEEHADLYLKMRSAAKIEPMKADESAFQAHLVSLQEQSNAGDKIAARVIELVGIAEEKIKSGDPGMLGSLVSIQRELSEKDPELGELVAWQGRMYTADAELSSGVVVVGDRVSIVSTDVKTGTKTLTDASFADSQRIIEAINAKSFNNITNNYSNGWSSSDREYSKSGAISWGYSWADNGAGVISVKDMNPKATAGSVQPVTTAQSLKNALVKATYQFGGITGQEGAAWLHANEIVIPSGALPCAVSSQYQMLENPALFQRDTISSSSTGQVWDAHDLGYNIKSVSNNLNDLNGCVSSATQIFQEQNAAALFYQTGGIYPTAQKLTILSKNLGVVNAQYQQQIPAQYAAIQGANDVSDSFTWVSDMFWDKDMYDRLTISPPTSGYQSSAKRGQVPVDISDAAKAGMGFRNPFTDQTASDYFGMADRIFAMQQQYSGKSQVMPSGKHEEPDWIVDAAKALAGKEVISKQSQGVLNPMAVEYDTLNKVNTAKVKYADLLGTELRNTLLASDAALNMSAAGGQYCEAMSQMGIMTEEAARKSEKNGMFLKGYIGTTKDYEAAKAYFASDTVPAIEDNTEQLDYFGNSIQSLDGTIQKNTDAQQNLLGATKQTSDILSSGATAKALSWSLTEFDTYIQSAESGLNSCIQSMSDWAIYQESILSMPVELGGQGFFKQESLGGFEKLYPQWGPFATEAQARGMPGPWGGDAEKTAGYITGSDGIKQALDGSQLSRIMSSASASSKDTAKNTAQTVDKITDLNGNLIATRDAYGNVMSDLISGAYGSSGAAWGARGANYGGSYGSFFGGWSGGGVGSGSTSSGWGASASSGQTGSFGGSQGYGSVQWAEGGITDRPTYGVFGEAGREAFVPISDRSAGLRILPQVMRELGVRTFAAGGIAGSGGLSALVESIGPTTITYAPTINADGLSKSQAQSLIDRSQDKFLKKVAKKQVMALKRRG